MRYAFKDNICFTSGKLMEQIAEPLLKNFDFSTFGYTQFYPDGSRTILTTEVELLYEEYSNQQYIFNPKPFPSKWKYSTIVPFDQPFYSFTNEMHKMIPDSEVASKRENLNWINHLKKRSNIYDRFHISYKTDTLLEVFHFGICRPDFKASFYYNRAKDLRHFTDYFYDRAAPIIRQMKDNKLTNPRRNQTCFPRRRKDATFTDQFSIKRYYVDENYERYITKREYDCLALIAKGSTTKYTAQQLGLSPRTVESYFTKMLSQLGLQNKHQLIELFWNSRLSK